MREERECYSQARGERGEGEFTVPAPRVWGERGEGDVSLRVRGKGGELKTHFYCLNLDIPKS